MGLHNFSVGVLRTDIADKTVLNSGILIDRGLQCFSTCDSWLGGVLLGTRPAQRGGHNGLEVSGRSSVLAGPKTVRMGINEG